MESLSLAVTFLLSMIVYEFLNPKAITTPMAPRTMIWMKTKALK